MRYENIARALFNMPWAIQQEKLAAMVAVLELKMAGGDVSQEQIALAISGQRSAAQTPDSIAVLPLFGVISQRMNLMTDTSGGTSTEVFGAAFRQAVADPNVKAIVFDVDSPGGGVFGVEELSREIYEARKEKKIVAVANSLAASAAYWISSAANELVVTPGGEVGSIGVFAAHTDFSGAEEKAGIKTTLISYGKYKVEGNELEPLGDEARTALQSRVNEYGEMFVKAVARNRSVSQSEVRNGYGEGRVVGAQAAVKMGMVDRIATLDETLKALGSMRRKKKLYSSLANMERLVQTFEH
ncbi:MAG: signal peptide peptidase SppA [Acidobacteria bacterium]|nr:signal peptide peptidase SppA [Acidobacteriota bacterium]